MSVTHASADELAQALACAEQAHGRYEEGIGHGDLNWPFWYARFLGGEQTGRLDVGSDDSNR
ncbi:hypothetical protein ACFVY1_37035 [Streptomyces sp. NPDC058293]|uniref:hypothetical protein n=1 Tax=Streptomyces sp. NPDC058293 TaxID=3346429 RepID=UPI0036EB7746